MFNTINDIINYYGGKKDDKRKRKEKNRKIYTKV